MLVASYNSVVGEKLGAIFESRGVGVFEQNSFFYFVDISTGNGSGTYFGIVVWALTLPDHIFISNLYVYWPHG